MVAKAIDDLYQRHGQAAVDAAAESVLGFPASMIQYRSEATTLTNHLGLLIKA